MLLKEKKKEEKENHRKMQSTTFDLKSYLSLSLVI